jgi:uncharacterized protein (TIGR00369 family)
MDKQNPLDQTTDINALLEIIGDHFKQLPFNVVLGLDVTYLKTDGAGLNFPMKDEFVGNQVLGILHGGVISAVLDATGGITAMGAAIQKMQGLSFEELVKKATRGGTIDMRVDYLRPGRGTHFYSTGTVMRTGNKIAVTRMELKNEKDLLLAVGTGTYIVG